MTAADVEEEHSELDDYFHGFHAAKQSIALTREFFDQRHEYLLETINSPRGSPRKRIKQDQKKKKKEKHRDKHKHKHKHKRKHKKERKKEKRNKPIRDEVSIPDNTYYAPLEIKEKGWRKHQTIATSAAIANQYETVAPSSNKNSSSKRSHKGENKQSKQNKQIATNHYNNYVNYHSDSDDFGVFDIRDFAKQIQNQPNKHSASSHSDKKKSKQQRKRDKKQKKKEKKRLEKERKRKEREIEEIERKMYNKHKTNETETSGNKKELKFNYKPKYRSNGTYPKPSLLTTGNNNNSDKNGVRLNNSQTSPATAAAFTFDTIPNITQTKYNQEIDTEDFHIVVVGQNSKLKPLDGNRIPTKASLVINGSNISPSATTSLTPSIPIIPSHLSSPPSQPPLCHADASKDSHRSDDNDIQSILYKEKKDIRKYDSSDSSSTSSSSSSSSDESEIDLDDVVISEMAPSPSSAPLDSFQDSVKSQSQVNLRKYGNDRRAIDGTEGANHITVPSMALSLLDAVEYETCTNLNESPFFDPAFWNNDFEKRKEDRKRHFTQNLSRIDAVDYAGFNDGTMDILDENKEKVLSGNDIESDISQQQSVQHHAKTMTKMKLKRFAKKGMFLDDIAKIFDPKYNKKWIKALNGKDDENVLHLVDDHSHQRKSTMAHWEHFDNQNVTSQSVKNGKDHISLVPKLIYFSKTFFESKEALFIFRLVKQGIETLISAEDDKVKMIEQLHLAFERDFDGKTYVSPKYTQLQILEKQIVWVGAVKDGLKDNPFLSQEAFDSIETRNDYLNEFKSQLDEESTELCNQHSELSKQEQERASIALRKDRRRSHSKKEDETSNTKTKKTKTKRLFAWFRKNRKSNSNSNSSKDEEKTNNTSTSTGTGASASKRESYLSYRTRGSRTGTGSVAAKTHTDYAENDKLPEISMDYYSLYFILLCLLLRYYNNGRNFLVFTISTAAIRMTELGDRILDIFGIMTKCGNIYRVLCYLKICTKVLATEASYFDDVLHRLTDIEGYLDDNHYKLMTLREKLHLKKVITRISNWCKLCISRYQHIFFGATGPRALKSCLRCWKFCFSMLYKLNNLDLYQDQFERKWCEKVKEIIKKSVFDYEFPQLVQLYKENINGTNGAGPSFFFSKQTYNQQYLQFNKMKMKANAKQQNKNGNKLRVLNKKKSLSHKISEYSKKLRSNTSNSKSHNNNSTKISYQTSMESMDSNSSSVYMDSPVEDATQLIMVIKGCRKYLVLDEEEYESAFKSCCSLKGFSLLKITSSQYMTLAFSFTNLYLRVLAFGIQEKIEERRLNLEFAAKNYKHRKKKSNKSQTKGGDTPIGDDDDDDDDGDKDKHKHKKHEEMNMLLENTDFEVDPSVWALYQELKRFYDDLKRIYKSLRKKKIHAALPEVHYADHYNDIIAYWCQYQGIKFTNPYNGYVTKLTSSETWKKISENALYSTSVIDLFTLIDPLQHWFLNLPYTNENLLDFAKLLTSIVQAYVNTLHEKITKYLLKELEKKELAFYSKKKEQKMVVWNFPMKLMIAINDIIMAKTQLQQTLSKIMLDRRYTQIDTDNDGGDDDKNKKAINGRKRTIGKSSHASLARYHTLKQTMLLPPEFDLNSTHYAAQDSGATATTFYKHKILPSEFNYNYFDEEDDIQVWNKLNCVEAFQTINKALSSISFLVGQGLNSDISHEVFLLLWENDKYPPGMPLKKEQVEDELMDMLWKKLCTKCDLLHENISPLFTPYILTDFFSLICADFIKLLIPKREKYVLNLNQLTRVEFAIDEIQNFLLDCYNIEPVLIEQNENLYRLKHILNLQLSGSKILINLHKELNKDPDWAELYQLENEPFVGPKGLWLIIKHRSKHHKQDQQLVKYYDQHSGIKAQFKSFTKAVRSRWG